MSKKNRQQQRAPSQPSASPQGACPAADDAVPDDDIETISVPGNDMTATENTETGEGQGDQADPLAPPDATDPMPPAGEPPAHEGVRLDLETLHAVPPPSPTSAGVGIGLVDHIHAEAERAGRLGSFEAGAALHTLAARLGEAMQVLPAALRAAGVVPGAEDLESRLIDLVDII